MRLRDATSKKILVEVTLLKAIEARHALSLDTVLKQLQALREGRDPRETVGPAVHTAAPVTFAAPPQKPALAEAPASVSSRRGSIAADPPLAEPVLSAPPALSPGPTAPSASGALGELWTQLLEAVGRASPFTRSYLKDAQPVSLAKNLLTIGFDPEFEDHIGMVDNTRNRALLQTKLAELGHPNIQFKFIKAEPGAPMPPPAPAPQPTAAKPAAAPILVAPPPPMPVPTAAAAPEKEKSVSVPFNPQDFKNDPLIQKALKIFKGQIVEVRA